MKGFHKTPEPKVVEKDEQPKVVINKDEVVKLLKKYKKIKKYMRSRYYTIKTLDGTETIVKTLLSENPPDD
jgi:hypothetical protein